MCKLRTLKAPALLSASGARTWMKYWGFHAVCNCKTTGKQHVINSAERCNRNDVKRKQHKHNDKDDAERRKHGDTGDFDYNEHTSCKHNKTIKTQNATSDSKKPQEEAEEDLGQVSSSGNPVSCVRPVLAASISGDRMTAGRRGGGGGAPLV